MCKALILDYGGTIDTDAVHWSEVIWQAWQQAVVSATYEQFWESYVFAERMLARKPLVLPRHNFLDLMQIKVSVELEHLTGCSLTQAMKRQRDVIADFCYNYARSHVVRNRPVLERLAARMPLALVSNFYGNLHTVLADFGIDTLFVAVVESAVVGVRKPDPQIFQLGIQALGCQAEEVVVVGDSLEKDIIPAASLGCPTVWICNHKQAQKEAVVVETSSKKCANLLQLEDCLSF